MSALARLALLAARRAAPPIVCVGIVGALALLRWREESRAVELAASLASDGATPAAAAREAAWTVATLLLLPYLVHRAAQTFARWRAGELEFLAPRAAPRALLVVSALAGHAAAALVVALLVAVSTEVLRAPEPTFVDAGRHAFARPAWIARERALRGPVELVGPETQVGVELLLGVGAGPATEVVVRARRGTEETEARSRVGTRAEVEIAVPAGAAVVELEVAVTDPEARVLFSSGTVRAWSTTDDARAASIVLALEFALLAASAGALALALGAFVAPSIASTGVLAAWLVPVILGLDGPWLPGDEWFEGIAVAGRGRVPLGASSTACVTACVLAIAAILATSASRTVWRRSR